MGGIFECGTNYLWHFQSIYIATSLKINFAYFFVVVLNCLQSKWVDISIQGQIHTLRISSSTLCCSRTRTMRRVRCGYFVPFGSWRKYSFNLSKISYKNIPTIIEENTQKYPITWEYHDDFAAYYSQLLENVLKYCFHWGRRGEYWRMLERAINSRILID